MHLDSNIFPIDLSFKEFQIQRVPYRDGLLEELRDKHNEQYSFFRNGDYIYISPGEAGLESLGEIVTIDIEREASTTASLMRHIFFRTFKTKFPQFTPTFYPFSFPSSKSKDDLIANLLPENLKGSISYKKTNEIYIKQGIVEDENKFLLVIDSSYRWFIRKNCLKLVEEGLSLIGLDVLQLVRHTASNHVAAPSLESVGRVISISGSHALVDTNSGEMQFLLEDIYLNKSSRNIWVYLAHHLNADRATSILQSVRSFEGIRNDPVIKYNETQELCSHISKLDFKNFDGFTFDISNNSTSSFPRLHLESPRYLFDVTLTKSDTSPSSGLNSFGPYDHGKFFEINSPRILVVYHKGNSGIFTQFLGWLKEGKADNAYFRNGFVSKYKLQSLQFHCIEIDSYDKDSYINAIKKVLDEKDDGFDLAIIETRNEFKKLSAVESPYWLTKSLLLQKGITVQYLLASNAQKPDYLIDSFALQLYAKLGGTPWVLPSSPNIAHELVVGIGSSFSRTNTYRGATQSRVVGITTFFNSDGRYLFNSKSREVEYIDYFKELLRSLKVSIDKISTEQAWQEHDIVRIIFHVFKPMKNLEVDVVSELIKNYPNFDIKFAFLSFGEANHYFLFDLSQHGIQYGRGTKGKYIPSRGTNLVISRGACLLQLKGPKDIKTDSQGFTGPLLIRIHANSTFQDALSSIIKCNKVDFLYYVII